MPGDWLEKRVPEFKPGQRVCIVGHGTATTVHTHKWTVDKVTLRQIVVSREHPTARGERVVDRFWIESLRNLGFASEWGWRTIDDRCQAPNMRNTK